MRTLKYVLLFMSVLLLFGCMKNDFESANEEIKNKQIKENVEKVFGTTFDSNHEWCTTENGQITIQVQEGTEKVQLLANILEEDGNTSLFILNEADVNGENSVSFTYDIPKDNLGMMVAFISKDNYTVKFIDKNIIKTRSLTRGVNITLPSNELKIT